MNANISLDDAQLAELFELLRIPSISADPARLDDVRAAADWIVEFVRNAGGEAEIVQSGERPLVDALFAASRDAAAAPVILCYGHFDVQPPAPLELWESDPFSPEIRDGWLYARGVADDKGQLWALLRAAADLAAEGALPVNVRFCCDGEEEVGGTSIVDFIEREAADADACVIFDTAMLDDDDAGLHDRHARHALLPRRSAHRHTRPALRRVRRRGAQRAARPRPCARQSAAGGRPPAG